MGQRTNNLTEDEIRNKIKFRRMLIRIKKQEIEKIRNEIKEFKNLIKTV